MPQGIHFEATRRHRQCSMGQTIEYSFRNGNSIEKYSVRRDRGTMMRNHQDDDRPVHLIFCGLQIRVNIFTSKCFTYPTLGAMNNSKCAESHAQLVPRWMNKFTSTFTVHQFTFKSETMSLFVYKDHHAQVGLLCILWICTSTVRSMFIDHGILTSGGGSPRRRSDNSVILSRCALEQFHFALLR